MVLAGTAPLMQRWYALAETERSPYRLYALSNAGALIALLTYPFVVEPALALEAQTFAWTGVYAAFLVASLIACLLTWRRKNLAGTGTARERWPRL